MTLINVIDFEATRAAQAWYWRLAGDSPFFDEPDFTTFTGNPLPAGEARPLTTAERGPDVPISPARRDRPTSPECAA